MLNSLESVPPQESIPLISELNQTRTPSDSGIPHPIRVVIRSIRDTRIIIELVNPEFLAILESLPILEFDKILRNSQRFQFYSVPKFRCRIIRIDSGITRNWWNSFRNWMVFRFDPIPESMELIPGSELIPQCSTSRNRMTAFLKMNLT
jgi:hypothetical protein